MYNLRVSMIIGRGYVLLCVFIAQSKILIFKWRHLNEYTARHTLGEAVFMCDSGKASWAQEDGTRAVRKAPADGNLCLLSTFCLFPFLLPQPLLTLRLVLHPSWGN